MNTTKPSVEMLTHDYLAEAAHGIDMALYSMTYAREGMTRPAMKIHDERCARLLALHDELLRDAQKGKRNEATLARLKGDCR